MEERTEEVEEGKVARHNISGGKRPSSEQVLRGRKRNL